LDNPEIRIQIDVIDPLLAADVGLMIPDQQLLVVGAHQRINQRFKELLIATIERSSIKCLDDDPGVSLGILILKRQ
jgi:hypothetical protein